MSDALTCEEREIDGPGGLKLFTRHWPHAAPRGLIAIVPGFSDHGGRYPRLVAAANAAGYSVAALDTRGHGRSGGKRGHVASFDEFLLDVDRFLAEARASWARATPILLWGHSMGGLITLAFLSAGFGRGAGVAAALACAPWFRLAFQPPRIKAAASRLLSQIAPSIAFASPVNPDELSRDLEVGRAYAKDPLVHNVISPRLFTEIVATGSRLLANPLDYGIPTLFIHGTADRIIDVEGTKSYFSRSPLPRKALKLYEGARHEIHNDPACVEAFKDAFAFFDAEAPKPALAAKPAPAAA